MKSTDPGGSESMLSPSSTLIKANSFGRSCRSTVTESILKANAFFLIIFTAADIAEHSPERNNKLSLMQFYLKGSHYPYTGSPPLPVQIYCRPSEQFFAWQSFLCLLSTSRRELKLGSEEGTRGRVFS